MYIYGICSNSFLLQLFCIFRLKIACERESDLEKQTLKGWSKMAKYINEWLEHAELLIKTYSDLPNDLESLLITIQKFEVN